jgi:hypothetical protein
MLEKVPFSDGLNQKKPSFNRNNKKDIISQEKGREESIADQKIAKTRVTSQKRTTYEKRITTQKRITSQTSSHIAYSYSLM